jgi:hypothetical protein
MDKKNVHSWLCDLKGGWETREKETRLPRLQSSLVRAAQLKWQYGEKVNQTEKTNDATQYACGICV